MRRGSAVVLLTLTLSIAVACCAVCSAAAVSPAGPGPTVATEDTMTTAIGEVLVRAPRVTLDEILDRVARGEARRDSSIQDESYRVTTRIVRDPGHGRAPVVLQESVYQVYRKRPGKVRAILLREYHEKKDDKDDDEVTFRKDIREDIVDFAFQPSARRNFTYRIIGRDLVGGHLVYRIEFSPRSHLDPSTPSGVVWVDTNDFVILRQEVRFDRSPVPVVLKEISRMVVERQRVDDIWVLKRVMLRAEMSFPIPGFGSGFDFAIMFDDYRLNTSLPDTLFTELKSAKVSKR
jgi:hypothetical protein